MQVVQIGFAAEQADDAAEGAVLPVGGKADADASAETGQQAVQGLHDVRDHLALQHFGLRYGFQGGVVAGHGLLLAACAEYAAADKDADDVVLLFGTRLFAF